ncbi:MAG: outer membrane protein assembly factor BamD, partial [Rhodospirillales bacterium]|nr:outer membrane protein assembly factor BamD [Rhodospirillales bacterium]
LDAAYRIRPGDALLIQVSDPDMDATPEADAVAVQVSAGDQPPLTLSAVEERDPGAPEGVETYVGGVFHALLKTVDASDAAAVAASPKALPIRPGDIVRAVYLDRENTLPGIPVDREGRVMVCGAEQPVLQLYRTWRESVEDKGERAQGRLRQIQRRPGNERATMILRDIFHAEPMPSALQSDSNAVPVNAAVPIPIAVYDASRARHARSTLQVEAMAASELEAAKAEGRSPEGVKVELALDELPKGIRFKSEAGAVAQTEGSMRFCGLLRLALGADGSDAEILPSTQVDEEAPPVLRTTGSDRILLRVIGEDGGGQIERWLRLVSDARLRLMDSTYEAERNTVHLGDRFNVLLEDFERDVSPTQDVVVVEAEAAGSGVKRRIELTETMPHSGRFSGGVRPVFFGTNAVPEDLGDQLPVAYGDAVAFRYEDAETVPGTEPGVISAAGVVSQGADGDVRLYSKRFRSPDQAVQVQFRMAECLFEVAKEQRKLGHLDKGAKSVAEGRRILEAALRENPGTDHAEQGQYLLGHLNQELAEERKDAGDMDGARPFFQEAISRFSEILSAWPEGTYAPQAQYHKALCLEMLGDYSRAGEEYVKMTYLHPNSPLVGDATIRLATYYYSQEKRYDTAARIYENFHKRFPTHERAAAALFMGAQCHVKQAESLWGEDFGKGGMPPLVEEQYLKAIDAFNLLIQTYQGGGEADQKLRAQAMYWVGDASCWIHDDKNAYLAFKRVIFEYPETEWARRARGRLLQDAKRFESLQ